MASQRPANDVPSILARIDRPRRAVVTAGMPYANGPLHLGHLACFDIEDDLTRIYLKI